METYSRREFFRKALGLGAAAGGAFVFGESLLADNPFERRSTQAGMLYGATRLPDLVAVRNGEPVPMFDKGIEAFGGMGAFVKKGQTVLVKPNIGWNRTPEEGANTNPKLVARIVEHCFNAGAKKVYVFDHTCDTWEKTYANSGIEKAAKNAGAIVAPAHTAGYYQSVEIKGATKLKSAKVHEIYLSADVIINVPVLKHHSGASMTAAMKNLMGVVWDRGDYHSFRGLSNCIAEFCLFRKPTLNVIDAYRVMMKNGPRGVSTNDLSLKKSLLIAQDIVAIDTAAAKIFGAEPASIPSILKAKTLDIGTMDLDSLDIARITM